MSFVSYHLPSRTPTGPRVPPPGMPRPHPIFVKNRSRKSAPRSFPIPDYHTRISLRKIYSAKPISFGSLIHYVKGNLTMRSRTGQKNESGESPGGTFYVPSKEADIKPRLFRATRNPLCFLLKAGYNKTPLPIQIHAPCQRARRHSEQEKRR
jgi:hypothetical protein